MCKKEKNRILQECLKNRESRESLETLTEMYIALIKAKAKHNEDKVSFMLLKLYKTWMRVDESKCTDIDKFLTVSLNWSCYDYNDYLVRIPQTIGKKSAKFERIKHLPEEEVIEKLNITETDYRNLLIHSRAKNSGVSDVFDCDIVHSSNVPQDVILDFRDIYDRLPENEKTVLLKKINGENICASEKALLKQIREKFNEIV